MKLWMRLGVEIDVTNEEAIALIMTEDCDITQAMVENILKERGITVSGNTYIPNTIGTEVLHKLLKDLHPYDGEPEWELPSFRMTPEKGA